MHQLKGPRLKLDWASKHLALLDREISDFRAKEPYSFIPDSDSQPGQTGFRLQVNIATPPPEISLRVGDVVHNLRASLDHLWWQLIIATSGLRPPDNSVFPISDRALSARALKQKLKPITNRHVRLVVESLCTNQPGKEPNYHRLLATLHRLDIVDKHQRLVIAVNAINVWFNTGPGERVAVLLESLDEEEVFFPGTFYGPDGKAIYAYPKAEPALAIVLESASRKEQRLVSLAPINELQSIYNYIERAVFGDLTPFFVHERTRH